MGKKKAFINKKNAVTFRLNDRTDTFQLEESEDVQMESAKPQEKDQMDERAKYGIYYDDDYDYMKHLKGVNEPITTDGVEKIVIRLPKEAIKLPEHILETGGKEIVGEVPKIAELDPDIAHALENSEDDGDLEDNFIELAGGAVKEQPSSSKMANHEEIINRFQAYRERKTSVDSDDSENFDQEDHELDSDDDDYPEEADMELGRPVPPPNRNQNQQFIDEQFDKVYGDYDYEKIGEGDIEEEIGGFIEPESGRFHELVTEYQSQRKKLRFDELDAPDEELKKKTLEMAELEDEVPEEKVKIKIDQLGGKRTHKWDCESILSTYSNLYNHPTLISEPPKKKANGISKKGLQELEKMDEDVVSITSRTSVSTYRPKDETPEERRARKAAIKGERRERRQEKKQNKLAFKVEKKQMDAQAVRVPVKGIPLK